MIFLGLMYMLCFGKRCSSKDKFGELEEDINEEELLMYELNDPNPIPLNEN